MDSATRRLAATAVATLVSALLWTLGSGLTPVAAITWLAPLPVLLVASRTGPLLAFAAGALAWLGGQLPLWTYYAGEIGMPVPLVLGLFVGTALVFGLAAWLFRSLVHKGLPVFAALSVPAVWVTLEYLFSLAMPHGAYWSLAYTQSDLPPVAQTASVTGVWGLTFLVLLVPAAIAATLAPGLSRRSRRTTALVALVLVAVPVGYGVVRLATAPEPRDTVAMAALSIDAPWPVMPYEAPEAPALVEAYRAALPAVADAGAEIVVLPEKIFWVRETDAAEFLATWSAMAVDARVDLVVGAALGQDGATYNVAIHLPADGGTPTAYRKHHMIPGLETDAPAGEPELTPGEEPAFVPGTPWGLVVCKDLDFPRLAADYRAAGATVLLAPALDFGADYDEWLHSRSAAMRGIEQGLSVVRAAEQGLATISDPYGRVSESGGTAIVVSVDTAGTTTVYGLLGDWFAWLAALVLAACLFPILSRRPRPAVTLAASLPT
ncbi:nitrilase-related carbon-nitrogen hydrolase [Phytomonospora endophytica]|uniref:Apolipoprotein N-acyltransferase n=1 Tax=Phytomonospora endophytica TaxID=714109 RepID=A0A841FH12_9ACTN|nr:nitrilase-related carbon-nitrogen hydrolase [Phytomonospora endophytica]MBB6032387.1 apolipoprotein N-acyltransferase [Phytomonospora endophytica]GIG71399.1 apolipoprotein N-acyltransferase [Phytomonospora endophytica]